MRALRWVAVSSLAVFAWTGVWCIADHWAKWSEAVLVMWVVLACVGSAWLLVRQDLGGTK